MKPETWNLKQKQTEAQFQSAVLQLARTCGWHVFHAYDARKGSRAVMAGFPDLVLVRGVRCLFVELKTNQGLVSVEQSDWHTRLRGAFQVVHVWRPFNWQTIEKELA
jgi:hypothetical protein